MSILVDKNTRLIVQGVTGREGEFHTRKMVEYGTNVVGGVRFGKGGEWVAGVPVFDTCKEAVDATGANASVIFVPARSAPDAILEAADAGIPLVVCITEGIPVLDMVRVRAYLDRRGTRLIGPNCPGLITPGVAKVGIIPGQICASGNIGVVSRSGTLTYEVIAALTNRGVGQSTCVGIGGDPVIGTSMVEALELFDRDAATEAVVLVGEIGGSAEEEAAAKAKGMRKKVVAYVAGRTAPPGKRMGHAGAIILRGMGTAESKIRAFEAAGVKVAAYPRDVPSLL